MKRIIVPFVMLMMTTTAANAGGLVTKHASSVQLTVDAARATSSRIGSTFSISGSNIATTDGTTAGTVSAGTISSGILQSQEQLQQSKVLMRLRSRSVSHTHRLMQFQLLQQL